MAVGAVSEATRLAAARHRMIGGSAPRRSTSRGVRSSHDRVERLTDRRRDRPVDRQIPVWIPLDARNVASSPSVLWADELATSWSRRRPPASRRMRTRRRRSPGRSSGSGRDERCVPCRIGEGACEELVRIRDGLTILTMIDDYARSAGKVEEAMAGCTADVSDLMKEREAKLLATYQALKASPM